MSKPKLRNRHAWNPLMRKGGVHEKSRSAKRAEDKRKTRALLNSSLHPK
ncbi:MAG: hypothetical protein AAF542_13245 [Pseudomonadota bacterium]